MPSMSFSENSLEACTLNTEQTTQSQLGLNAGRRTNGRKNNSMASNTNLFQGLVPHLTPQHRNTDQLLRHHQRLIQQLGTAGVTGAPTLAKYDGDPSQPCMCVTVHVCGAGRATDLCERICCSSRSAAPRRASPALKLRAATVSGNKSACQKISQTHEASQPVGAPCRCAAAARAARPGWQAPGH